jgi:LmbE family N-acetylglucosaminyl deacetylase
VPEGVLAAPPAPACDDAALTGFDGLLVLAPHPDDEVLGFAGLTAAYLEQGKPVEVVVVTEGDAYCEACRFWSSGSVRGATCDAADLAELARVRRGESTAAAALLGRPAPAFLGYPDTGLAAAWREARLGRSSTPLRRSDFGACADCESCAGGYGEGPATELTAATLAAALSARIAATSERTLLATTHPLDGHGDHAGLGNFVKSINDGFERPRPVAYAVIHAHTPKHTPAPDCWYPGPEAVACACPDERCAEADPGWIAALRAHRFRPGWPDAFPDDAPYGEPLHLCLPERMYRGAEAEKLRAVEAYRSQLGTLARQPEGAPSGGRGEPPAHLAGIVDCNGYLTSFVRSTEAFALSDPAAARPPADTAAGAACDPAGEWVGGGAAVGERGELIESRLRLALVAGGGGFEGRLSWPAPDGGEGSEPIAAERTAGCGLRLTVETETWHGTVSRDGASLYVHREAPAPGFWALHR